MSSPIETGSANTDTDVRVLVPVKNGLTKRFYEATILLHVLNTACTKKPARALDSPLDTIQLAEHTFKCFVNKLAQLCNNGKGGNTVTGFTVLQYPDRIEYRFASNQRTTEALIDTKDFTISILQILRNTQGHDKPRVISDVLLTSLSFGRPQVTTYLRGFRDQAALCISACEMDETVESRLILRTLQELHGGLQLSNIEDLDNNAFAQECGSFLNSIDHLHQSEVREFINNKTKEGRIDESERWCELRHFIGRLLSYLQTAKLFVQIPRRWPELFDNLEVCWVASSVPDACPLRRKISAADIIGRMTSNIRDQEKFKAHAERLQMFDLDKSLQAYAQNRDLRPFVHAEVLLLDSLENDGGTHSSRFFSGYKYIGTSKPTCRMCSYYFSAHSSDVEVRQTHRNLYRNWRMPDVYEDQGQGAVKHRQLLMDKVLNRVRDDAFRILKEKLAEWKRHDSNTNSTYPKASVSIEGILRGMEDLRSDFWVDESRNSSFTETGSFDGVEEDNSDADPEEDGGVRLS